MNAASTPQSHSSKAAHLTVLSHTRFSTLNGELKILDFGGLSDSAASSSSTAESDALHHATTMSDDSSHLPPAVREMLHEYDTSMNMRMMQEEIASIDDHIAVERQTDVGRNFVYDVYFLETQTLQSSESQFFDANGASITIELEETEYGKYFSNDLVDERSDSGDDGNDDDEDSNAEDYYRNDYPDSDDSADYSSDERYVYDDS
ncbi:hypothetical protein HDU84_000466 [Entophlyctis sp. JEL0112]|nr:hypothetical protein HDU84_000466 [Entophlyctis sp. JEL0112]